MPRDSAIASEFATRLRTARAATGLSQEDLAHEAGMHRTMIGRLERGESAPTIVTLVRLADALGVDASIFVSGLSAGGRRRYRR